MSQVAQEVSSALDESPGTPIAPAPGVARRTLDERTRALGRVGLLVGALVMLPVLGTTDMTAYRVDLLTTLFIYTALALSVNLIVGYLGILDFSAIVFYGFGAYFSVILESRLEVSFWVSILPTVAATVVLAGVIAAGTARLVRYFLAIASMALVLIAQNVATELREFTGGGAGFLDIEPVFGFSSLSYLYLCGIVAAVMAFVVANLMQSRTGRAVRAIRDGDLAAAALGVNTRRYRAGVVLFSSALAAIAGTLYAHASLYLSPDTFGNHLLMLVATAVVVGGLGRVSGSILAAVLMVWVPQRLTDFGHLAPLVYSVLVIIILLFAPTGLAGAGARIAAWATRTVRRAGGANGG